ncbi:LysM peptidoglycan-binding domain-containing protein [Arthrobacter sp. H14]|uniref:LysM peptidoglycan-binding domain-containing protein n=1 Tax=Arthrobacter sp. H14 TaxID=1312959 RepID=UPI00047ABD33|nr:LysM peptidoglycan-binding domain-containing protein [Arthrobacter sp. H14]
MSPQRQSTPISRPKAAPGGTRRSTKLSAAVSTAAIPAVVLSSLALAQPAQAAPALSAPRVLPQALTHSVAAVGPVTSSVVPSSMVAVNLPSVLVPTKRSASKSHTVQAGETVSSIARQYGLSTHALLQLNNLRADTVIYPGDKVRLGGKARATQGQSAGTSQSRNVASSSRSSASTYTVKSGDTIGAIARRHGVSTQSVLNANGLNMRSVIYPGQKLKLSGGSSAPAPQQQSQEPRNVKKQKPANTSASSYTVRSGDTISAIARRHGVSTQHVLELNGLSIRSVIYPGQKIKVSGSRVAPQSNEPNVIQKPKAPSKQKNSSGSYTVKSGDTLGAIASRHGVALSALLQANNMRLNSVIYPGNKLAIPGGSSPAGDSPAPENLVPNTFLHYTYPKHVVAKANVNLAALLKAPAPSAAQIQEIIVQTARSMGVPPSLALAHAYQESGFNHRSVSPANAIGTMQVIPSSGEWASQLVGRQLNLLDPHDNITAGVAIIGALLRTSDSRDKAIGSYYQGQWSVHEKGFYDDTKRYVKSVKALEKKFR